MKLLFYFCSTETKTHLSLDEHDFKGIRTLRKFRNEFILLV